MLTAGTYDAVNLCVNGGFDEVTPSGLVPAGWGIEGAAPNPATYPLCCDEDAEACVPAVPVSEAEITNFFARLSEPVDYPGYRHKLNVVVRSEDPTKGVTLSHWANMRKQNTRAWSRHWKTTGYVDRYPFTVEFSLRVLQGAGTIEFQSFDITGGAVTERTINAEVSEWARYNVQFTWDGSSAIPESAFLLKAVRTSETSQFEFEITAFQWIAGYHDDARFTGDPSYQVTPRNTIIMVMGPVCPIGTRPLREVYPDAEQRFPLGALNGTLATGGSESHTHETGEPVSGSNRRFTRDGGEEAMSRNPPHKHGTSEAPNRPYSYAFNYCIKL